MADSIESIFNDLSDSRGHQLKQAIRRLREVTQPLDGSVAAVVLLPNPDLEEVVLAGIIHGLSDMWTALREEGVTMVDDETLPSLLGLLMVRGEFQQKLRRAVQQSLTPPR
jgi:hypothetical protein